MTGANSALILQILYSLDARALLFPIVHPFSSSNRKGGKKSEQLGDLPPSCEHKVTQVELSYFHLPNTIRSLLPVNKVLCLRLGKLL